MSRRLKVITMQVYSIFTYFEVQKSSPCCIHVRVDERHNFDRQKHLETARFAVLIVYQTRSEGNCPK